MLLSAAGHCLSLDPFPSIGVGAHRALTTLCPPSPSLAYPDLCTHPSFPLVGCANGAPGLSLFHCPVSHPHRGGQLPSTLARSVQVDAPYRRGAGGGCTIDNHTDGIPLSGWTSCVCTQNWGHHSFSHLKEQWYAARSPSNVHGLASLQRYREV